MVPFFKFKKKKRKKVTNRCIWEKKKMKIEKVKNIYKKSG